MHWFLLAIVIALVIANLGSFGAGSNDKKRSDHRKDDAAR